MRHSRLTIGIFFDDRLYWACGEGIAGVLKRAHVKSREADNLMGFTANQDKFQIATKEVSLRKEIGQAVGLKVTKDIKSLGVITDMWADTVKISPKAYDKCVERLKAIGMVSKSPHVRRKHVQSLALPVITWAGCIVQTTENNVVRVRKAASEAVRGWMPRGRSRYLMWNVGLRPGDDPQWAIHNNVSRC